MNLIEVFTQFPLFFYSTVAALGLCIGSFLNVVIHRFPIMLNRQYKELATEVLQEQGCQINCPKDKEAKQSDEKFNLIVPRSRCPKCNHLISAMENIPVISYLILKGKCKNCQAKISFRYPLVELMTAILFFIVAYQYGVASYTLLGLIFTAYLIAMTGIDIDGQILPDLMTITLMWLGLLAAILGYSTISLETAVIGAMAGYLSLWSIYWAFKLLTGKEGMGYGDFKLFAALGAWLGWQMLPQIILTSAVVGLVAGLIIKAVKHGDRNLKIAFGPYLALGGWLAFTFPSFIQSILAP